MQRITSNFDVLDWQLDAVAMNMLHSLQHKVCQIKRHTVPDVLVRLLEFLPSSSTDGC